MNASLFLESVLSGVLLGGLYAAVAVGFSLAFGLMNIVNIAHPTIVVIGAYAALYIASWGIDPVLAGVLAAPAFAIVGYGFYQFYARVFEARGMSALSGMTFFFGLMFVLEIGLVLAFGVDYRFGTSAAGQGVIELFGLTIPWRLLTPFLISLGITLALVLFSRKTFVGQALTGVAQDEVAIRLVGANPVHIKSIGFSIALATAAIAGALLVVASPVYPASGREFIGRVFAIAVLGGLGSARGALAAGMLLGVVESLMLTYAGAHWAVATGFGLLLVTLAVRPQGMFAK